MMNAALNFFRTREGIMRAFSFAPWFGSLRSVSIAGFPHRFGPPGAAAFGAFPAKFTIPFHLSFPAL